MKAGERQRWWLRRAPTQVSRHGLRVSLWFSEVHLVVITPRHFLTLPPKRLVPRCGLEVDWRG